MWNLHRYDSVDSTNDTLKELIKEGAREGTVVVATTQKKGRGRQGREWISPEGNLYFSFLLQPTQTGDALSPITLVMGCAVATGLRRLSNLPIGIKWPNDVMIGGRKVGGILTEVEYLTHLSPNVIVGIGLNINMKAESFSDELIHHATSLHIETDHIYELDWVLELILSEIKFVYRQFKKDGFEPIKNEYLKLSILENNDVTIHSSGETVTGIVRGVDATGALLLEEAPHRPLTRLVSGDAHLL